MVCFASNGRNLVSRLTPIIADSRGTVAAYVTVLLPFLMGGALLTVDAARLYSLHTFMQAGADAFALAAAAELDGQAQPLSDDSITRANNAIDTMMANRNQMRLGDARTASITVASRTYLSSLPASDATATTSITTDPKLARYVQVKVAAANFTTFFPATFLGAASNSTTTSAIATAGGPLAGAGRQLCLGPVAPMFICNPFEGTGYSIFNVASDITLRRRQIKLQSGGATYFPGNFGWLDTPELGNGANALRDALATTEPISGGDCRIQRTTVSQKTGNVANADDAMNTRFDLWNGPFNNGYTNSAYTPAQNVRKGYIFNNNKQCNPSDTSVQPPAVPNKNNVLGRDTGFSGNVGNGTWDFNAYWANNYGTAAPNGWSNLNLPARYDVYAYELANNLVPTAAVAGNATGEKGSPECYAGGSTATYDRRVLYVAVINCTDLGIDGNSTDLGAPIGYGKFFLTEPVSGGVYYSELVGLVGTGETVGEGGSGGAVSAVQENVQLYR